MKAFSPMLADIASSAALASLCRRHHVRRLDLFGSATDARFDPARSDLDFLVDFENVPDGHHAESFFGLLDALQSLFGRSVDLVEGRTLRNPYLRRRIETERRQVYPAL